VGPYTGPSTGTGNGNGTGSYGYHRSGHDPRARGGRGGEGRVPERDLEGQPIDPRQPPVEVDRLGDTETRAAKAAALFRPRFSTRWSS
jgi:hypothetical protein